MAEEFWYRYEEVVYAPPLDEFEMPVGPSRVEVHLRTFLVVRHTTCGVRLDTGRFVNSSHRKRFACPTVAEALESFKARKAAQARILRKRLSLVEQALKLADRQTV